MHTTTSNRQSPAMADFASVLLHANESNTTLGGSQAETADMKSLQHSNDALEKGLLNSRNLSNVLGNIKDNGPASGRKPLLNFGNNKSEEDNEVVTQLSDAAIKAASKQVKQETVRKQAEPEIPAVPSQHGLAKHHAAQRSFKALNNLFLLLLFAVVAAVAAMQYHTKLTINRMSEELSLLENPTTDVTQSQRYAIKSDMDAAVVLLNTDIQKLNDAIEASAASFSALNLQQQAGSQEQLQAQLQMQQKALDELMQKVTALTGSIDTLSSDMAALQLNKPRQKNVVTQSGRPELKANKLDGQSSKWSVNLASLADRSKARRAYDQLRTVGVVPLIQEVELKGKKIYRLSVDGFATRTEAERFVKKVSKKYGFESGWIRRS